MAVLVVTENRIIFTEKDSCVVATGGGEQSKDYREEHEPKNPRTILPACPALKLYC